MFTFGETCRGASRSYCRIGYFGVTLSCNFGVLISVTASITSVSGITLFGASGCCYYSIIVVTGCRNYTIQYGSFESAFSIRVDSATDRAGVIFLVARCETGCGGCFRLGEIVNACDLIYESVFVTLIMTNCTLFVFDAFSCESRINVNYPLVVVSDGRLYPRPWS